MNALTRTIADPSPVDALRVAEQAHVDAHNAANAAALALREAERGFAGPEKDLQTLNRRGGFDKPKPEELESARAKVDEARTALAEAQKAFEDAKMLQAWRAQELTAARREAFAPAMVDAVRRRVAAAEKADELHTQLADLEIEYRTASADIASAWGAGAKLPGGLTAAPSGNFELTSGADERRTFGIR